MLLVVDVYSGTLDPNPTLSVVSRLGLSRQVAARKLKPHPPRPPSLHERLLEGIKAERKLRPVSPDMIRRSRLGEQNRRQDAMFIRGNRKTDRWKNGRAAPC